MKGSDIFIICVPTPINKKNKPDLRNLISACKIVGKNIKKKINSDHRINCLSRMH